MEGGLPAWVLGEVLTTHHRKSATCYEPFTKESLGPGLILFLRETNRWRALVNEVMNRRFP